MKKEYTLLLKIGGIHCGSCVNRIDNKITQLNAKRSKFDLSSKIMTIDFIGEEKEASTFIDGIRSLGYSVNKVDLIINE